MKIKIAGHYTTKIGELWDQGLEDLLAEAVHGSLKNAQLAAEQIEAVFVASKAPGEFNHQLHLNALLSQMFAHYPPAIRVEGACTAGGLALVAAEQALAAKRYKTVMVIGAEKMTDQNALKTTEILSLAADQNQEAGSSFPGLYALLAQAHMQKYGTTREQLSAVAVKNHHQAMKNPQAHFHREFTLEQVSQSSLVADPLRLLDCSTISDGASAVILSTNSSDVKKWRQKPQILGYGHAQDSLSLAGRESLTALKATQKAGKQAYQQAKVKPKEIQIAEVHDCFTIAEIMAIEDLGWFKKGEGGEATLAGKTDEDGQVVVNLSGGLKAFGHPIGATGIKQVAFLAEQLEQGSYELALAHNVGGSGATAVAHVLAKN